MGRGSVKQTLEKTFDTFARKTSHVVGRAGTFVTAIALVVVWLVSGPVFHFSDTWQLIINTSTTIITFLIVFLIQNVQNREMAAIHLKLDELLIRSPETRSELAHTESLPETDIQELAKSQAQET